MNCRKLNENIDRNIVQFLENKTESYPERDPYAYDPKARYSPATLINEWFEDRNQSTLHQSDFPLVSTYMEHYKKSCKYSTLDNKGYFKTMFDSRGLGQELLMDHLGLSYYNNYTTTYDLCYNHLVKGLCGPLPRKYIKGAYKPETDLTLIFGNLTQWGIKEGVLPKPDEFCRPLPPEPEYKSEFRAYERKEVTRLNDFPFKGKKKSTFQT